MFQKLNELASVQSQSKALTSQDKLGEQNFLEDKKNVFEPISKSDEVVSEDVIKTITESSKENNKALAKIKQQAFKKNERERYISILFGVSFI